MRVKEGSQEIQWRVNGYEYPPGWGAGMPYDTDWLETEIIMVDGADSRVVEENLLRFSELENVYDNLMRILEGEQSDFNGSFTDQRLYFRASIVEDRDIFVSMGFEDEEGEFLVKEPMTSEAFYGFVKSVEDILVANYRPKL
ncbi:hypothetical protein LQU94_06360 [Peptoniphilus sp. KCTC 25270]|uniref:WapI family immunity protein n=1 Tax=Peptoniphilus sp. KCTC 25270 TaxID=2897414 RepID=UPI001E5E1DD1|nr:hypothetical protein [Peptoniphilus sp. KCTC 25270]MCD1147733.1 hypothetical protein [Peptoniphilus sp. KCTC 25270]